MARRVLVSMHLLLAAGLGSACRRETAPSVVIAPLAAGAARLVSATAPGGTTFDAVIVPELGVRAAGLLAPETLGRCLVARGWAAHVVDVDWAQAPGFDWLVTDVLPAALAQAQRRRPLVVIGWGLGGVAVYAALPKTAGVDAAIALGAPWVFLPPAEATRAALALAPSFVHGEALALGEWLFAKLPSSPYRVLDVLAAGESTPPGTEAFVRRFVGSAGLALLTDLERFAAAGRAEGRDGTDYALAPLRSPVPLLALGGRADRLARSEEIVGLTTAHPRSGVKVLGRAGLYPRDFGHLDLVIGPLAGDVCAAIAAFVEPEGLREPP